MASLTLRKSIEFCKLFGACGDFVDTRKRFQMMALRHSKRMITRDQFEKLFIIAPDLATHIFNLFDSYRRNTINFNSFLLALTVFTGSDNDSKIDLIRDVFSSSRSPDVRRPELIQIVDLIIDSACTLMGVNVHDPAYIAFANDRAKEIVDAVFQPYSTRIAVSVPFYAIHHLIDIHDTFNVLRACVLNMALQTLRSCPKVYRFLRPIRASIASSCGETYSPTNSLQELMFPGQWMRDCNSMGVYNSLVQALISAEKSFEDHPSEDSFENHPIEDSSPYALEIGNRIVSGTEQPGYFIRTPALKTMNIADPSRSLLFQGYVYKQSWFFQRLRRRWVVIVNNMLYSFCRQDSKRPNLVLSLSGAICDPVENLDTSFLNHFRPLYAFHLSSIICRVTRIIYLPSAELRDRWVYAIRTASRDFELSDHYHISSLANSDPFNLISCRGTHSAQDYMLSFVDKSMVKDNELHSMRIESGILRFNEQHVFAPTLALFEDQFKVYFIRQIIPHWIRLDEIISAGGVMSVNSVGLIMRRILSGLNFLYEHHITLGVLSPANILISLDNLLQHQVQIVDINLRKYFMPYLDPHTQLYAAPEVEKGYHFDSKAEMWSVGAILYRLLTPGSTQTDLVLAKRGVLNLSRTWGSKDVTTLLKRLLSRNPSRRYCPADTMRTRFIANATPKRFELHFPKPVSRERYHHYYPAASQSRIS